MSRAHIPFGKIGFWPDTDRHRQTDTDTGRTKKLEPSYTIAPSGQITTESAQKLQTQPKTRGYQHPLSSNSSKYCLFSAQAAIILRSFHFCIFSAQQRSFQRDHFSDHFVFVCFGASRDHFSAIILAIILGFSIFFSRASRAIILSGDHFSGRCLQL